MQENDFSRKSEILERKNVHFHFFWPLLHTSRTNRTTTYSYQTEKFELFLLQFFVLTRVDFVSKENWSNVWLKKYAKHRKQLLNQKPFAICNVSNKSMHDIIWCRCCRTSRNLYSFSAIFTYVTWKLDTWSNNKYLQQLSKVWFKYIKRLVRKW